MPFNVDFLDNPGAILEKNSEAILKANPPTYNELAGEFLHLQQSATHTGGFGSQSNIVSYSGADYRFLIHIPNQGMEYLDVAVSEIEDEIAEVLNVKTTVDLKITQYSTLLSKTPIATPLYLQVKGEISDLKRESASLEKLVNDLKQKQAKLREKKSHTRLELNSLQTLSFQTHVDKQPVRALGHSYPKAYTSGATLIAGSMIFTVINEHPLAKIIDNYNSSLNDVDLNVLNIGGSNPRQDLIHTSATTSQLPPLHVSILGVNEAGRSVNMTLFGVEFINDGMVMSIQDLLTENTVNFVAQDIDLMRTLDTRGSLSIPGFNRAVTASSFLTGPIAAARRARRGLPF